MAEKINWLQVGTDFQQKYEGTYCRYLSPITKKKEIFMLNMVEPQAKAPPDLTLYNDRCGELFLSYNTEAELDFSFPDIGYFQCGVRAVLFSRNYERQWKKGMCRSTVFMSFPYDDLLFVHPVDVKGDTLEAAFEPRPILTLDEADKRLADGKTVSVSLTKHFALGVGNKASERWLWFDAEPVAELVGRTLAVKVPAFEQEIRDYLRLVGDNGRAVI